MIFSAGLVLVILAAVVWLLVIINRPKPIRPEMLDAVMLMLLAFYFSSRI